MSSRAVLSSLDEPMPAGARAAAVAAVVAAHLVLGGALLRVAVPVPPTPMAAIEATLVDATPVAAPAAPPSPTASPPPAASPTLRPRAEPLPRPLTRPVRPASEPPVIARAPDATPDPAAAAPAPLVVEPQPSRIPPPPEPARPAAVAPAASAAPLPVTAAVPAAPKTLSIGAVQYLQPPVLDYPLAARRAREEGRVHVRVLVDPQGLPAQTMVVRASGHPRLDAAATAAAQATRFRPYTEDGVALPFWVVMPLIFELEN